MSIICVLHTNSINTYTLNHFPIMFFFPLQSDNCYIESINEWDTLHSYFFAPKSNKSRIENFKND